MVVAVGDRARIGGGAAKLNLGRSRSAQTRRRDGCPNEKRLG